MHIDKYVLYIFERRIVTAQLYMHAQVNFDNAEVYLGSVEVNFGKKALLDFFL